MSYNKDSLKGSVSFLLGVIRDLQRNRQIKLHFTSLKREGSEAKLTFTWSDAL